jgi:hypothetical protein
VPWISEETLKRKSVMAPGHGRPVYGSHQNIDVLSANASRCANKQKDYVVADVSKLSHAAEKVCCHSCGLP